MNTFVIPVRVDFMRRLLNDSKYAFGKNPLDYINVEVVRAAEVEGLLSEKISDYEQLEKQLKECAMTWVPALLATLIERARREPIFKGWMGLQSFISRAYKKAGDK